MTDIKLPELGESVTEGTIIRWLKQVGDTVEVDEPIVEISTDKVDTEVPSPVAGTISEILAEEDDEVEVGAVIARVGDGDDAAGDNSADDAEASAEAEGAEDADDTATETAEADDSEADKAADAEAAAPADGSDDEADATDTEQTEEPKQSGSGSSGETTDVKLPELGESVTEGTIIRWLKQVGDTVEVDEPIVEISTDKVDTEVPSPVAGTITELLAEEDDEVEVGAVIARVGDGSATPAEGATDESDDDVADAAVEAAASKGDAEEPAKDSDGGEDQEQDVPAEEAEGDDDSQPGAGDAATEADDATEDAEQDNAAAEQRDRDGESAKAKTDSGSNAAGAAAGAAAQAAPATGAPYVTPIVRKLANEKGVDLASLTGSGVGGRIRKEDVLAAAEQSGTAATQTVAASSARVTEPSPLRGTTEKMSRLRKTVAKRTVEAMTTMAQLTTVVEVDVTKVAALRDRVKEQFQQETGTKLSFLPFFAMAAVEGLRAYPKINSTDDGETITYPDTENLSIAVDTERGLLSPVVPNAGEKNLRELAESIADLAERTRDNKLSPDELAGGTFTLTNTGSRGALFDTPIVTHPQRAILGVGTVVKRPAVISGPEGDALAIRSMVYLALSYDHRVIDGADAARYLSAVKARLEEGDFEGDLGL